MNTKEIPEIPAPVRLSEKAAEMVVQARKDENLEGYGLRIGVTGGGCSGLNYLLDFDKEPTAEDFVHTLHGVLVFVDPFSAAHLTGTVLDFIDGPDGAGFKFDNPNVMNTSCSGCSSAH